MAREDYKIKLKHHVGFWLFTWFQRYITNICNVDTEGSVEINAYKGLLKNKIRAPLSLS